MWPHLLPAPPPFCFISSSGISICLRLPPSVPHPYLSWEWRTHFRHPVLGWYAHVRVLPVIDYWSSMLSQHWGDVPASKAAIACTKARLSALCHLRIRAIHQSIPPHTTVSRSAQKAIPPQFFKNPTVPWMISSHCFAVAISTRVLFTATIDARFLHLPSSIVSIARDRFAALEKFWYWTEVTHIPDIWVMQEANTNCSKIFICSCNQSTLWLTIRIPAFKFVLICSCMAKALAVLEDKSLGTKTVPTELVYNCLHPKWHWQRECFHYSP